MVWNPANGSHWTCSVAGLDTVIIVIIIVDVGWHMLAIVGGDIITIIMVEEVLGKAVKKAAGKVAKKVAKKAAGAGVGAGAKALKNQAKRVVAGKAANQVKKAAADGEVGKDMAVVTAAIIIALSAG